MKLNSDVFIAAGSVFKNHKTIIDKGSRINGPITVKGAAEFIIGKYCAIGDHVDVITSNHEMQGINLQYDIQRRITGKTGVSAKKNVTVGNNVWIGNRAILLPGIIIGDGAIIGAGSVVNKNVPAFTVFAGSPAKFIRNRFNEETTKYISKISWWNWSIEKMKNNKELFEADLNNVEETFFKKHL